MPGMQRPIVRRAGIWTRARLPSAAMTATNLSSRPAEAPESEAKAQRRLGRAADAGDPGVNKRRRLRYAARPGGRRCRAADRRRGDAGLGQQPGNRPRAAGDAAD